MTQATADLAETGYVEAMHLMAAGELRSTQLWRPEALDHFREALVDGVTSAEWMDRFNFDLRTTIGPNYSAKFIFAGHKDFPSGANIEDGPLAVVKLTRGRGLCRNTAAFIIRPEADQVLTPVIRYR